VPNPTSSSYPGSDQEHETAIASAEAAAKASALRSAAPLLDLQVLEDMERDFPDSTVAERFAEDFCATLEGKLERLTTALESRDAVNAQDAVLSLTSSAAMVGALRLNQAARAAERHIATDQLEAAARSLPLLQACGAETQQELQRTYLTRR